MLVKDPTTRLEGVANWIRTFVSSVFACLGERDKKTSEVRVGYSVFRSELVDYNLRPPGTLLRDF